MDIPMNSDPGFETPGDDPLDQNRHCFKKGRLEFMGGPIVYEQGHNYKYKAMNPQTFMMEEKTLMDNERKRGYSPDLSTSDPVARKLGVDAEEY